jgi:hypothetical protein
VSVHGPTTPMYSGHYWAGAYFTGKNRSVTQVAMTIKVPDAVPSTAEFYYVLLSVWDSAGSYDQIGFTNDYGVWGWTYSYTSACAGSYYYNPDQATLVRGQTYTFTMNLSPTGELTFGVEHLGAYSHSLTKFTGGAHFLDQSFYSCNSATYYDYTDYEEVYSSIQQMPSADYMFRANSQNNASVTAWSSMGAPLGGGSILSSGPEVIIKNEAFSLSFASGIDKKTLPVGTANYSTDLTIAKVASGTNVTVSYSGTTSAFTATFTPSAGAPGFTSVILVTVKSPVAHTQYNLMFKVTDGGGAYSYVTLQLTLA